MRIKIIGIFICMLFIGTSIIVTQDFFVKIVKADINDGLVAYWSFNDGTASDNSGNGHNGNNHGATISTGILGNAFYSCACEYCEV